MSQPILKFRSGDRIRVMQTDTMVAMGFADKRGVVERVRSKRAPTTNTS